MSKMPAQAGKTHTKKITLAVLALLLLVSNGCALPTFGPKQPTLTSEATRAVQSTAVSPPMASPSPQPSRVEKLPPALVESDPMPFSEVGPKTTFTFYFNQAMERGSVQAALQAEPALSGSFQWVNDATVKFVPDRPLPANTSFAVSFSTKAQAANGLPLPAPVDVSFKTSDGFQLVDQLPKPGSADIDPTSAVVATFTHPMVALGAESKDLPPAFTLIPAAKGRSEWLNTSTYIFYPDPALMGGIEYTVQVNTALTAADGSGWVDGKSPAPWKFSTARPRLLTVRPDAGTETDIDLDERFVFTFNQPMQRESVQQNLSLSEAGGKRVSGSFEWNDNGSAVTFKPDVLLQRASEYLLKLNAAAQGLGGSALEKEYLAKYFTVPDFALGSSEPAEGESLALMDVFGGVRLKFTAPLAKQDLTGLFSFAPSIGDPFITNYSEKEVYISGILAYSTDYTLTLNPAIRDRWGQTLQEPVVVHFRTQAPQPSLALSSLLSGGTIFLTPRETAFSGKVTNVQTLKIRSAALNLEEFARLSGIYSFERSQKYDGPPLASFDVRKLLPSDKSTVIDIPLSQTGKPRSPGLYYYQVESPDLPVKTNQRPPSVLMVVSRVHLALKQSENQLVIWALNLDNNQPLPGASLAVFTGDASGKLTPVGSVVTDAEGMASLDHAFPAEVMDKVFVVLGKPGDPNFSLANSSWTEGVHAWNFGIPTRVQEEATHTYIYTDRPIYQPGQTVDFRVMVHDEDNGRYVVGGQKQVNIKALGEFSPEKGLRTLLYQVNLPLSTIGSASGSFVIPDSAAPGYYSIQVNDRESLGFQVANYRKPEIELSISFSAQDFQAGQDVQAEVQARYYFGAPAANLTVDWALYGMAQPFYLPQRFVAGPVDTNWLLPRGLIMDTAGTLGKSIEQGQFVTGADGKAIVRVAAAQILEMLGGQQHEKLTLEATLKIGEELPVSNRAQALFHPSDFYIGIRPDTWSGQVNKEASFTIQTFNWQKTTSGSHALRAVFQKVVFQQKANWNWQSGTPPYTRELSEIASTDFQVDATGQARIAFTPPEPGTYQVDVSGDGAMTQVIYWVSGAGRAAWPVMPEQQIRLVTDADSYLVGQTAKVLIPNPLGDKAIAWITVERGRVMQTDVVQINGNSYTWEMPVNEEDAPNVYVSVLLVGAGAGSAPMFRVGYTELTVPPRALELQVSLMAQPPVAAPGGEVSLKLHVSDAQGKPAQGEFSIAVVDKAVMALAEPNAATIQDAFYGRQPNAVRTSLGLAIYGRPTQHEPTQDVGGRGGGGGNLEVSDIRSNFQDTAYWNGAVTTDAQGNAEIKVRLPDNLTTWVVTARGLNRDLRVGESTLELVVSKDLLIRPVAPRFLVAGDRVQLAAVVNNNTAKSLTAEVRLDAGGLELENPQQAIQRINLPAQGRVRVTWWVKALDIEQADLVFSVAGGGLQDSARPAGGSLPVLKYAAPQTFATAGILTEAGEKLEVISAPRSFDASGGELRVELSPSLAAGILSGLKAMETFPAESAEPLASRLLANLETYQALQTLAISSPELKERLDRAISESLAKLVLWQNKDGGWGWQPGGESDLYLSTYLLVTLGESRKAGLAVNSKVIENAANFVAGKLVVPENGTRPYRLDELVFQYFALQQSGFGRKLPAMIMEINERLSPWSRALLAVTLFDQDAKDARVRSLISNLQSQAVRSATGAHWESLDGAQFTLASPVFTTAVVSMAIARLDPAAAVLSDAVRYLSAHRRSHGAWASTYESTWVLMALTEVLKATGELSASFTYSAMLNEMPLASGQAGGPNALTPIESRIPLENLNQDVPNGLKIIHKEGVGRLYYRAYLQVYRPVDQITPLNRGATITRKMVLGGQDCTRNECPAVDQISLSDQRELQVHLTLTLPQAMYHLVVEDFIPAGAEITDLSLQTTQQGSESGLLEGPLPPYSVSDPFRMGWNRWLFNNPKIFNDHIRWTSAYVPAGTYELVYRLTPLQPGEFHLLPAHVYETYFPEVEGASSGAVFSIEP